MGAIHFSVDLELIRALRSQLDLGVFVETGTYRGDTAAAVAGEFATVITIELDPALHTVAAARLAAQTNVAARLGSSPDVLREVVPTLGQQSVLYWLDAHWCGPQTAGQAHECPLLAELDAIGTLNSKSLVLIDDARLFCAPPPVPHDSAHWPRLDQVVERLGALSPLHRMWIVNDVIIFAPVEAEAVVLWYCRVKGVDLERLARQARLADAPAPLNGADYGFNAQFLSAHRAERIFAHHLKRLGIERVLDVGAHTGQFAGKLRALGFAGTILSVEPQRAAHGPLVENTRKDARWIALARQAAGASRGIMELNLAENGWSSSLRSVHPNHVRAERTTRTVGRERVFVNRSGELLRPEIMAQIEALKIDVQGFEDRVLAGFSPFLANVRLLLVEMSMVECYEGAPDMFALDRLLVGEFGFSRISLEPSYYDDTLGVVQQYDGIYHRPRPERAATAGTVGLKVGAVVTSVGGSLEREGADGSDIGATWLKASADSWLQSGAPVASVAERAPPPDLHIQWVETPARPAIIELLRAADPRPERHLLLTNGDIAFGREFHDLLPQLDRQACYCGQRTDVVFLPEAPDRLTLTGVYPWGFDYFLIPADLRELLLAEGGLSPVFKIGDPWWDYTIPVFAMARGFLLKRLPSSVPALHYIHPTRYAHERWRQNGEHFLELVERLRSASGNYAPELLDQVVAFQGETDARLDRISRFICETLP